MDSLIHHCQENRFELELENYSAELNYHWVEDNRLMSLNRVFVPQELRGKGIASRLTQRVLVLAREQQWKVIPVCPFVVTYLKRHPEWQDLLQ